MVDKALRAPKKRLLEPLARRLGRVSPTALTLAGFGVGVMAAVAAALSQTWIALGLWLLNRTLDGLDGELARARAKQTDFGGYLDIMADLAVYALIPLGLTLGQPAEITWLALAVMLASFYINAGSWMYLSALLEKRKQGALERGEATSITMPGGLIEGAETIFFYCLFLLFPGLLAPLFFTLSALVLITIGQRLYWAYRTL